MKKIISLLVSVCALASVFTTAAYAADEPTMKLVAEKITFDGEYAEFAGDYDWSEWNADAVGGSYDTYSLKLIATGIEVATEGVKSGKSTIYVGDSITGYQVQIGVDTEAEYDMDWKWGLIKQIATPTGAPDAESAKLVATGTVALEPAPKTAKTITKDDETVILEFLVTVDAGKEVNFTLNDYALFLATFPDTSKTPTDTSEYKKSSGTMTTTTATLTLPAKGEEDDGTTKVEISAPMALTAGELVGTAWDVKIKNFDSSKEYRAYFTSNGVERNAAGQRILLGEYAETEGDLAFAAILNKVQLGADDAVELAIQFN